MRKTQCFFKEPAICLALPYNNTEINIISLVLQTRQLIKGVIQPSLSHKTLISCLIYKTRLIILISVLLYGKARQRGLNLPPLNHTWLLGQRSIKNSPANAGVVGRCELYLWIGKIPWSRKQQHILVFLPGKPQWTEEPGGFHPCVTWYIHHKESDTTEQQSTHIHKSYLVTL